MAFLLNPYNLRALYTVRFGDGTQLSGKAGGGAWREWGMAMVGILLDWIVIRDFIHKAMKSNWDESNTTLRWR